MSPPIASRLLLGGSLQAMAALDPSAAAAAMAAAMAPAGTLPPPGVPSAAAESAVAANLIRAIPPTRVLVLLNMVTEEELTDPQEYDVGAEENYIEKKRVHVHPVCVCIYVCMAVASMVRC